MVLSHYDVTRYDVYVSAFLVPEKDDVAIFHINHQHNLSLLGISSTLCVGKLAK